MGELLRDENGLMARRLSGNGEVLRMSNSYHSLSGICQPSISQFRNFTSLQLFSVIQYLFTLALSVSEHQLL
jgi:hypothetical protein